MCLGLHARVELPLPPRCATALVIAATFFRMNSLYHLQRLSIFTYTDGLVKLEKTVKEFWIEVFMMVVTDEGRRKKFCRGGGPKPSLSSLFGPLPHTGFQQLNQIPLD